MQEFSLCEADHERSEERSGLLNLGQGEEFAIAILMAVFGETPMIAAFNDVFF
jgi:hypothetical protein